MLDCLPISSRATLQMIQALGFTRPQLELPYPDWLIKSAVDYWQAGLEVVTHHSLLECMGAKIAYDIRFQELDDYRKRLQVSPDTVAILSGTGMHTLSAMVDLIESFSAPIMSSNLCIAQWLLGCSQGARGTTLQRQLLAKLQHFSTSPEQAAADNLFNPSAPNSERPQRAGACGLQPVFDQGAAVTTAEHRFHQVSRLGQASFVCDRLTRITWQTIHPGALRVSSRISQRHLGPFPRLSGCSHQMDAPHQRLQTCIAKGLGGELLPVQLPPAQTGRDSKGKTELGLNSIGWGPLAAVMNRFGVGAHLDGAGPIQGSR